MSNLTDLFSGRTVKPTRFERLLADIDCDESTFIVMYFDKWEYTYEEYQRMVAAFNHTQHMLYHVGRHCLQKDFNDTLQAALRAWEYRSSYMKKVNPEDMKIRDRRMSILAEMYEQR